MLSQVGIWSYEIDSIVVAVTVAAVTIALASLVVAIRIIVWVGVRRRRGGTGSLIHFRHVSWVLFTKTNCTSRELTTVLRMGRDRMPSLQLLAIEMYATPLPTHER